MANYTALIERAKQIQHFESDNQLAKRMGVSRSYISNWKNGHSNPDGFNTIILMELADVSAKEAMGMINRGYATVSSMVMTAGVSLALLASHPLWSSVYYVKFKMWAY